MSSAVVDVAIDAGVAMITMNDPATRNANSTRAMVDGLVQAIERVNDDIDVRAVVFTGAGPAFSSGGELSLMESFQRMSAAEVRRYYVQHGIQKLTRAMLSLQVPAIAAVNGPAYGSGFGMALLCDLRIASTQALFAMNFATLGILPGDGGALFLTRAMGGQQAARLLFTGDALDANEAKSLGLVLDVCEPEALVTQARALAQRVASNPGPNLRLMKRLLQQAKSSADTEDFLELTVALQALAHHTPEHRDALAELREKLRARRASKAAKQ
jgi:2-(1,2-epoxy-1,2-dihydrophenyl)acetyl-CoA isomerase